MRNKFTKIILVILFANLILLDTSYANILNYSCKSDDTKCIDNYVNNVIKKSKDISEVLKVYEKDASLTNGYNGQCNNIGRIFGKKLYLKYGEKVLNFHNNTCGEPYAYGFMEEMGRRYKDSIDNQLPKLLKYCREDNFIGMCAYGIGISQSNSEKIAGDVQRFCEKNFPPSDLEKTLKYEVTSRGICLLGWVSGRTHVLPESYFKSINDASKICEKTYGDGKLSCLAEATFAYTYIGNPSNETRIKRVYELKDRCKSDRSSMCYRFIGKALDDYFLFQLNIKYDDKKMNLENKKLIEDLCSKGKDFCMEGMIFAHIVHRSKEDAGKLCGILAGDLKSICLRKVSSYQS